jgi:hypothetical protein
MYMPKKPTSSGAPKVRFARIPAEVIHNPQLGPDAVRLLAYRCSKIGQFALNETDVRKRLSMGRDAFHSGLRELLDAGVLTRAQEAPAHGRFGRAVETLNLRDLTLESHGVVIVQLDLILRIPSKQLALYLFLKARPPTQPMFAREIRARFALSPATAEKRLTWLIYNGLARSEEPRRNGRFSGIRYFAVNVDDADVAGWSAREGEPVRGSPDAKTPETVDCARKILNAVTAVCDEPDAVPRVQTLPTTIEPETKPPEAVSPHTYLGLSIHRSLPSTNFEPTTNDAYFGCAEVRQQGQEDAEDNQASRPSDLGAISWLDHFEQTNPVRARVWRDAIPTVGDAEEVTQELSDEVICNRVTGSWASAASSPRRQK